VYQMDIVISQYCCGLYEMGDFSFDEPYPDEIDEIKEAVHNNRFHCILTTINDFQNKLGWGKILRSHGFKRKASFQNTKTRNKVFIYIRLPDSTKRSSTRTL
jgi:hypothetical protein